MYDRFLGRARLLPALVGALMCVGAVTACGTTVVVNAPPSPTSTSTTSAPGPGSTPPPASSKPAPTVTVTATKTATATRVEPSRTSSEKPQSWPAYAYYGPSVFDVCATGTYPFDSLMYVGWDPIGASASGYAIESLQEALRSLNYNAADAASLGEYDYPTQSAVLAFQQRKGLTADGKVGPQTWRALHYWMNYYEGNCP